MRNLRIGLTGIALLACAIPASATNGFFAFGYSTQSKGMGGTGVAMPKDALCLALNPAGLVDVEKRVDAGLGFYFFRPKYSVSGTPSGTPGTMPLAPGTVKPKDYTTIAPALGYVHPINSQWTAGIAFYANGGLHNEYPASANGGKGTFYGGPVTTMLQQAFLTPAVAYRVNPQWSVGLGFPIGYQLFKADGLMALGGPGGVNTADGVADNLSNNGTDTSVGIGARLGAQYKATPELTVGLAYQTKIPGSFDKYSDLFAEKGDATIPAVFVLGAAYKTDPMGAVALEYQRIMYSDIAGIGNPHSNLDHHSADNPSYGLGGDNGPGLGWEDCDIIKLGYERRYDERLTWRVGASYGNTPIGPEDVFLNILAPVTQEWHLTAGATYALPHNQEVTLAMVYSPENSVSGPNRNEVPGAQTIKLSSHEYGFEIAWARKL